MKLVRLISPIRLISLLGLIGPISLLALLSLAACNPEPPLHLYDSVEGGVEIPAPKLELSVVWDYRIEYSVGYTVKYDWRTEWYYNWDNEDINTWGEIGYTEPSKFYMRRYYCGDVPYGPHLRVLSPDAFYGNHYQGHFDWGFWDLLVYNEPQVNVLSIHFDEADVENIIAYTNPSTFSSRYHAPRYTRAFYAPEPLFTVYYQAFEVNKDLRGFDYDEERNVYVRQLNLTLLPVTYIYLTQVILHNNNGRITSVDGVSNLSGMSRTVCLQTQRTGDDAVSVNYSCRMKKNLPYISYDKQPTDAEIAAAEKVDIVGGRLMTFGMCGQTANKIESEAEVTDQNRHFMDVTMQFNNGMDSTFVFDVTDQVRKRYKGGVITVELNVDNIPIPTRKGGSGFDAVVKDYEEETHEFEMK